MDPSTALNIIALCISLGSLIATGLLVARQNRIMRHANELPILVSLTQDFRSHDFQRAQYCVLQVAKQEYPANSGFGISNLPEGAREYVSTVISFYISLGAYLAFGLADENIVLSLFGYRASQSWAALEHLILRERELRNEVHTRYAAFFEDLICRFRGWANPVRVAQLHSTPNSLDADASSDDAEGRIE